MMKYRTRPGIVVTKVCSSTLLVPNREASEHCPYVLRLPLLYACYWQAVSLGRPMETLYEGHALFTHKSEEECRQEVDRFLADLCEKGFLIAEEDEA